MIIKLTEEQLDFLQNVSTIIPDGNNNWYYMPFWFKQIDGEKFEIVNFEKLPESVTNTLKALREQTK